MRKPVAKVADCLTASTYLPQINFAMKFTTAPAAIIAAIVHARISGSAASVPATSPKVATAEVATAEGSQTPKKGLLIVCLVRIVFVPQTTRLFAELTGKRMVTFVRLRMLASKLPPRAHATQMAQDRLPLHSAMSKRMKGAPIHRFAFH